MPSIVFLHGRESGPGGTKATWLATNYGAVTPPLPSLGEVTDALPAAREALAAHAPSLVVASSFGGAVAVALLREGTLRAPVVLIAPAAKKLGVENELPAGTRAILLHGSADDIVPVGDSVALTATGGDGVQLQIVDGGDHRLNATLADGTLARAIDALLAEGAR